MRSRHLRLMAYTSLCDVTQATLVAQLLYASPAWSGFIKADEKAKLQSILNKTVRYPWFSHKLQTGWKFVCIIRYYFVFGYLKTSWPWPGRCFLRLKRQVYHLRKRSHGLKLSPVQSSLLRKNFIYRMLYTNIYWICLFYHTVYFWICYILFYYYFFVF